jgi:hypothetical protein
MVAVGDEAGIDDDADAEDEGAGGALDVESACARGEKAAAIVIPQPKSTSEARSVFIVFSRVDRDGKSSTRAKFGDGSRARSTVITKSRPTGAERRSRRAAEVAKQPSA